MRPETKTARSLVLGFWLALCASNCGPDLATGSFAVELTWRAPEPGPLRGVLSGIVDTIRIQARSGGKLRAQQNCDYEAMGCQVPGVPAGSGYELTADALQAEDIVYSGEVTGLTVVADEFTSVAVTMEPAYIEDLYAPAAVADLTAIDQGADILLSWSATGNDAWAGRASEYLIYWSRDPITEATLAQANQVDGPPRPEEPYQPESLLVRSLPGGTTYYFALKVEDAAGNLSVLSNVASATLP